MATAAPKTRLSTPEVSRIARAFCKKTGVAVERPLAVSFPAPDRNPSGPEYYWQPRWRVAIGPDTTLEVVDATGVVSQFTRTSVAKNDPPPGKAMPREKALARSRQVLAATGIREKLGPPDLAESQVADPPKRSAHRWSVVWPRMAAGHPYKEQSVSVVLNAETGALIAYGAAFRTPPAVPTAAGVTLARAAATAQKHLAGVGASKTDIIYGRRYWASPELLRAGAVSAPERLGPPRLVWEVQMRRPNRQVVSVYVDAASGGVLGRRGL